MKRLFLALALAGILQTTDHKGAQGEEGAPPAHMEATAKSHECVCFHIISFLHRQWRGLSKDVYHNNYEKTIALLTFIVLAVQLIFYRRQANIADKQVAISEQQRSLMSDQLKAAETAANAATGQIRLARGEFLAAHRPDLKIHSVRLLPSRHNAAPEDQPLRAEFTIVNAGTSAANIIGSLVVLERNFPVDRTYLDRRRRDDNDYCSVIPCLRFLVGTEDKRIVQSDLSRPK